MAVFSRSVLAMMGSSPGVLAHIPPSEPVPDLCVYIGLIASCPTAIVQELCESRGGRPGLSVLTSLLVSVDVKIY